MPQDERLRELAGRGEAPSQSAKMSASTGSRFRNAKSCTVKMV